MFINVSSSLFVMQNQSRAKKKEKTCAREKQSLLASAPENQTNKAVNRSPIGTPTIFNKALFSSPQKPKNF